MLPGIKLFDLTGRAAIITGGSKGLGHAMAAGLASAGAPGLVDGVAGDHICISPPFTVSEEQVERIVAVLRESIEEVGEQLGY